MKTPPTSLAHGQSVIARYVENMPGTSGVYRMLGVKGEALYVGKAKNLKQRVAAYARPDALGVRLQRMVAQTASMEITTTRSEAEALLLEANLIKKLSPRYNILLKDDKSFPYILLSGGHDFPRISKHRGPKLKPGKYFGPFTSAHAVDETITLLQKAFLLRPCSDNVFKNRTRPCLQYQIKRCSAPCVGRISQQDYARLIGEATDFLSGKSRQIQDRLVHEMQELSLKMRYEKAGAVRDRIRALAQMQHGLAASAVGDADVIALAREGRHCCIQLFSFRGGRNYGNRSWFPEHAESFSDGEVISAFIANIYQTQPPPALILVSHLLDDASLLEEALYLRTEYKVEILQPLRGKKRGLINQALRNAREALSRQLSLKATEHDLLAGVQALFALEELPNRIEVYDNSHISGTHAVGAMIVAGPEGFMKSEYRRFDIKREDIAPGDDYAMLREVLTRRFRKLQEGDARDRKTPDLVLIDGGVGQVSAAAQAFEELGIQGIVYAGIAKGPDRNAGREQFFIPGRAPFQLPQNDAVLHYLQRLRDEAHRFAIGAHRAKRGKSMQVSALDAVPGIGPKRKKALLNHFGSARAVSAAGIEELQKVPGINRQTAEALYGYFHGQ